MESTDSSTAGSQHHPNLPPGFRFHPTDEELVVHYLKKKAASAPLPVAIIAEIDLYKFDPWELPAKATFGEQEWYFFSPRDRKYPNGARPNRAATSGYWKATGTDKPVLSSGGTQKVGVKKALVFYGGKPPKGVKTNWIMHEYRLTDNKASSKPAGCQAAGPNKGSLRLDDWVLCRIYKKSNAPRPALLDHERDIDSSMTVSDIMLSTLPPHSLQQIPQHQPQNPKLKPTNYGATLLENTHHLFDEMLHNEGSITTTTAAATTTNAHSSLSLVTSSSNTLPLKRATPSMYWADGGGSSSSLKRFHEGTSDGSIGGKSTHDDQNNMNSIGNLLSQIPQTHSLHQQQQTPLGAIGDGRFRQPYQLSGLNWYS